MQSDQELINSQPNSTMESSTKSNYY